MQRHLIKATRAPVSTGGSNRVWLVLVAFTATIAASSLRHQPSEESRAMLAALEHIKQTQRAPHLLSGMIREGRGGIPHDSIRLAEISSVALRVTGATPPFVLDTFVMSVSTPTRTAAGVYTVTAGGYYATNRPSVGCRIGGPSNTYTVRCTSGECKAELVAQSHGSGRCE